MAGKRTFTDDDWQVHCDDLQESVQVLDLLLSEARSVAGRCWSEWKLTADGMGANRTSLESLAEQYPWLKETSQ